MNAIPLDTGELTFTITRDGQPETWKVDLITAMMATEEVEGRHNLQEINGRKVGTQPFLLELADAYAGLGCVGCTPTAAKTIWIAVMVSFLKLSDQTADAIEELIDA